MVELIVRHADLTGAPANPDVLVDGPKWDAAHTVTGAENVDNTSDLNKPVSIAQAAALAALEQSVDDALLTAAAETAAALAAKADLASPVFTGNPRAPTAITSDNDTSIATTAFVQNAIQSRYPLTGGVLSGDVTVTKADPAFIANKSSGNAGFWGKTNSVNRWLVAAGNGVAESGNNAGSDFGIYRYADNGSLLGTALGINRATGNATFSGSLTAGQAGFAGAVTSNITSTTGTYYFGNSGTKYLNYDGTNFNVVGGGFIVHNGPASFVAGADVSGAINVYSLDGNPGLRLHNNAHGSKYFRVGAGAQFELINNAFSAVITSISDGGNITTNGFIASGDRIQAGQGDSGIYYFGNPANGKYLIFNGSHFGLGGADLYTTHEVRATGAIRSNVGYTCKEGSTGGFSNIFNIWWNGNPYLFIDNTNIGRFAFVSDYRTKKDVTTLPGMWDTVKALRPIKYTNADWKPSWESALEFKADDVERWGFIAHELQETLTEDAASGKKDVEGEIQSPNPWTVIAALTKALQEAMARIETLEAKVA